MTASDSEHSESEYYFNEKGRRFKGNIRYLLPADQEENARLFEQHLCIKIVRNDRNFLAPVKEQLEQGIQVLDSACGHGAPWTIDMANEYPNSKFTGVDISDGIPSKDKSPENTTFSMGNIINSIPLENNTIDFAFQRFVVLALSNDEWNSNIEELFRVVKPGGFIELLEVDFSKAENSGPLFNKYLERLDKVSQYTKFVLSVASELEDRIKQAGFVQTTSIVHEYPLNHGKNGISNCENFEGAAKSVGIAIGTIFEEWKDETVYDKYLEDLTKELAEYKTCLKVYTVCAQKPKKGPLIYNCSL